MSKLAEGDTAYSADIEGAAGNYGWSARFDVTGHRGYLGISQRDGGANERVLLSPAQVRAMLAFLKEHGHV